MSGHHDATKPYQPRRGPERPPPPPQPAEGDADAGAVPEAEAEPLAMEQYEPEPLQYEPHPEHEEEEMEEGDEEEEDEEEGEGGHGHEYAYDYGTGEAVPMDADAAARAQMQGAMLPMPANAEAGGGGPHAASNTLTLSFNGEVFVFESVSPDKVQAVLLLLGGRELAPGLGGGPSSSASYSKRMNYHPHRMASLMRFRQKRSERNFDKKIRYSVRKEVAHRMQRHKGQFTSAKAKAEDGASPVTTSDGLTNWGAVEGRPPSAAICKHCGKSSDMTPMMRKGPDGPRTLCNACGLSWANKGHMRDISKCSTAPLQVVPPANSDAPNGTTEAAPVDKQQHLAIEAAPVVQPAPAANGHDS